MLTNPIIRHTIKNGGSKLKTLLQAKNETGVSFREIGRRLDMHFSNVWHACHSPGRLSLDSLLKVADYLGVPEEDAKRAWAEDRLKAQQEKYAEYV